MQLRLLSDDKEVVRMACEGDVDQPNVAGGISMFESTLGGVAFTRKVLLNLEKVGFMGSSGINWLIASNRIFNQAGGRLVLHSLPPMVKNALQLMRMSLILNIANDEAAARAMALGEGK